MRSDNQEVIKAMNFMTHNPEPFLGANRLELSQKTQIIIMKEQPLMIAVITL